VRMLIAANNIEISFICKTPRVMARRQNNRSSNQTALCICQYSRMQRHTWNKPTKLNNIFHSTKSKFARILNCAILPSVDKY
jgi:hypothetical protein